MFALALPQAEAPDLSRAVFINQFHSRFHLLICKSYTHTPRIIVYLQLKPLSQPSILKMVCQEEAKASKHANPALSQGTPAGYHFPAASVDSSALISSAATASLDPLLGSCLPISPAPYLYRAKVSVIPLYTHNHGRSQSQSQS